MAGIDSASLNTTRLRVRKNNNATNGSGGLSNEQLKARLLLSIACLWPLFLLVLFASSAPHVHDDRTGGLIGPRESLRFKFRGVLDRADIMGYGPTHPRIAVVIVGDDKNNLVASVESVFGNTDMNRIFVVFVVVDGQEYDPGLEQELKKVDSGAIPHWHGFRPDLHSAKKASDEAEDEPHGQKVHVLFNQQKVGLSQSRSDAVEFIAILEDHHEKAGLKSEKEDLILLLLQSGSQLTSRKWIGPVTEALIVPPPLLDQGDQFASLKLANAVSFNLEGTGKCTSFDTTFTPIISEASANDLALSNGASYPTPALNGAAIALRLHTYSNLPMQDLSLHDEWPTNLDLALNLWLCADGIDMLKGVEVTAYEPMPALPLPPDMAARFAAAWMDSKTQRKFYLSYTKTFNKELTYLEWETFIAQAQASPEFTLGLPQKCRSFMWYAENINSELSSLLNITEPDHDVVPNTIGRNVTAIITTAIKTNDHPLSQLVRMTESDTKSKKPDQNVILTHQDKHDAVTSIPVNETELNLVLPDKITVVDKAVISSDSQNGINQTEKYHTKEDDKGVTPIPKRNDKRQPSKPLCDECLRIVQKAEQIDISYVDVRDNQTSHPHKGARDEYGNWSYVHNETALRSNPPPFVISESKLTAICEKHDNNWRMLNEKVFADVKYDKEMEASKKQRVRIFCTVYTIEANHDVIPGIRETWGPKCDGFMVASNKTDSSIDAVDIPHNGEESYQNIWQKVRSIWSYVYDNYYEKYDWFHIGGDDLFLIVENLRYYLESEEILTASNGGESLPDGSETVQTPLYLGRRFAYMGDMDDIFNSGGSGYTLNKAALKTLVVKGFPIYFPNLHTFSEDTMVARIFRHFGIYPYETKDEAGGERYMPFTPGHHYGYRIPENHEEDWYAKYSINIKEGADHCAARSVAFHYLKDDSMRKLYALLYKCPTQTTQQQ